MSQSVVDRLREIVRSADLAVQHAGGLDATALAAAETHRDAALFRIVVIGEAASHLPAEIQALAPEIPWNLIQGMRNHLVHSYWQIDLNIVARTIALRLDPLKTAANRLIDLIEDTEP